MHPYVRACVRACVGGLLGALEGWGQWPPAHTNPRRNCWAQELFAHGPSKRSAKLAIVHRPTWDRSALLVVPPKHKTRQSIADDPLQRCAGF